MNTYNSPCILRATQNHLIGQFMGDFYAVESGMLIVYNDKIAACERGNVTTEPHVVFTMFFHSIESLQ